MDFITQLIINTTLQVWTTFTYNWPFLLASVFIAVWLKLYIDPQKVSAFLIRYRKAGVIGATAAAVTTPLCSCGTTAIVLGMLASTIPWAPIIAFMVSSPLTSPEGLIYSAGLFGWPFAVFFFLSSIVLGLLGGGIGEILDRRGWLANQTRFSVFSTTTATAPGAAEKPAGRVEAPCGCGSASTLPLAARTHRARITQVNSVAPVLQITSAQSGEATLQLSSPCGCSAAPVKETPACSCGTEPAPQPKPTITWRLFLSEAFTTGKNLLVMFLGFAFIGYFLNGLIPSTWVSAVFGPGNIYSVPLAATLGLPLYINSEASLPLVRALIEGGMSQGAAMAFLITGAGTSIGALAGALTIARWRVIGVIVGTLWVGSIALGYLYDLLLITGLF